MHSRNRKPLLGFFGRWVLGALLLAAALFLPAAQASAEDVFYYHNDALGSPVAMTNDLGAVVWEADYQPFGEELLRTNTKPNAHRFTGKELDVETGLHYFGARYYDARLGRFISADPILMGGRPSSTLILPQRHNLYAYTTNNPYRYVDADGQFLETAFDIVSLGFSISAFYSAPTLANAAAVIIDTVAAATPFIPGGAGVAIKTARAADKAADVGKVASKSKGILKKADFSVTPDGVAVPLSQSRMRKGFDDAGFPSRAADKTPEPGMIKYSSNT